MSRPPPCGPRLSAALASALGTLASPRTAASARPLRIRSSNNHAVSARVSPPFQGNPTRSNSGNQKKWRKKKKEKNFRTRLSSHFFLAFSGPTPNFYSAAAWAKNLNDSGKLSETHCVCANHVFCDPTRGANSSCSCSRVSIKGLLLGPSAPIFAIPAPHTTLGNTSFSCGEMSRIGVWTA